MSDMNTICQDKSLNAFLPVIITSGSPLSAVDADD